MLHEFVTHNRQELIKRCIGKAAKRDNTSVVPINASSAPDYGVTLFLQQLVDTLRAEEGNPAGKGKGQSGSSQASLAESSRTATLHGKALFAKGYSVDQVVHGYGDVCQSITELAGEVQANVTLAEFHTLNRLLDDAIAAAVSSYARNRDTDSATGAEDLHGRMGTLADHLREHINAALKGMEALKRGNIGVNGATGMLVNSSLIALRDLIDKSLPEIRLATGMTTPPTRLERR